MFQRFSILVCTLVLAGCFTPTFRLPPATVMHPMDDSAHFKGFFYDTMEQKLTVVMRDGEEVTHYNVPREVARSFARDRGHIGYYDRLIKSIYPIESTIQVNERNYITVNSRQFKAVAYDGVERELFLLSRNDTVTVYEHVPMRVYRGFLKAPIKGSYFAGFIRDLYEVKKDAPVESPEPIEEALPE